MQTSLKKLALTGSVAALLLAMPVSIDLGGSGATDATFKIAGIRLTIDSAQARVGRPATPGSVAGVSRRTTRRTVARTTPAVGVRPGYVRPVAAGAVVAGAAAVAVGTTVATLPAQCTTVVVDGVAYRRCGQTYYRSSGGTYVVVNPPR